MSFPNETGRARYDFSLFFSENIAGNKLDDINAVPDPAYNIIGKHRILFSFFQFRYRYAGSAFCRFSRPDRSDQRMTFEEICYRCLKSA